MGEQDHIDVWWNSVSGRGKSKHEDHEVEMWLAYSRETKEKSVAGAQVRSGMADEVNLHMPVSKCTVRKLSCSRGAESSQMSDAQMT